MFKGILIFCLILLTIIVGIFYLLGKGIQQKFGRFDMPPEQLNKVIYEFLPNENILDSDLPYLREKLYELGFTDLSKEDIKIELKHILQENNNWN
jgi:hypothetical protein